MSLSERPDGSYFTHTPGKPSTSRQVDTGSDEPYTFRHYPGEEGSPSFDSRPTKTPRKSNENESTYYQDIEEAGEYTPYQIQEQPNPSGKGDMTVIQEIGIQAPQPIHSSPRVAQTLQEIV